jgi:hypothetical protein
MDYQELLQELATELEKLELIRQEYKIACHNFSTSFVDAT